MSILVGSIFGCGAQASFAPVLAQVVSGLHDAVIPYVVVVLCVALGLIVVCRSANRSPEVKLEDLEEE